MLTHRSSSSSAHHASPIWVMILLLVFFTTAQGRTWPRFVSKQRYDIDKIYSTSWLGKKSSGENASFASEINSRSRSSNLHFDDTGDYNHFNGNSSEGTKNASMVDSTHITGPFHMGKDVNASVYHLLCPSTEFPFRNKFRVGNSCSLFVQCRNEMEFVVRRCNTSKKGNYFNETTGHCETTMDKKCSQDYNGMHAEDILKHVIDSTKKSGNSEVDQQPLPSTLNETSLRLERKVNEEIEELCRSKNSHPSGLHAHPYLCEKYIQCGATADAVFINTCGPGTVFNPKTLNCDWPINVEGCNDQSLNGGNNQLRKKRDTAMATTRAISCEATGLKEDAVVPDPNNCNKYHVCSSAGNVYTTLTCNEGTLFNPLTSVCDFADNVDCSTRKNDFGTYGCDGNDEYIAPHPDHCNKFVECDHGILAIKTCPPATLYDREQQRCDHAFRVTCRKPVSLEHDIDVNFIRKRKRRNTNPLRLACEFNYIAPHPNNCHQFVECENRRIFIKNCGPGTAFNPLLGQCDWPYNVRQVEPNDCTRFRQCDGRQYQPRACPRHQIFDAERNRCVFGDPFRIRQCSTSFFVPTTTRRIPTTTTEDDYGIPPPS